jgi:hypothetical protein
VDRAGRIVVAWDEVIEGQRVAAARELEVKVDQPVRFGSAITLATGGPAMYPVLVAVGSDVLAVWTTGGEASVVQARVIRLP